MKQKEILAQINGIQYKYMCFYETLLLVEWNTQ